jgi:Aromatic-ring hydroxylase, C-terminal
MGHFTSSSIPGCRAPHFWLNGGRRSLYDALGDGFGLLRFDSSVGISGIVDAASRRGVPLTVLDVDDPAAFTLYARKLVLVRPDRHVAWRSDHEHATPIELIDLVRGARVTRAHSAA